MRSEKAAQSELSQGLLMNNENKVNDENSDRTSVSMLAESKEALEITSPRFHQETFAATMFEIVKRTIPTALSYDFSINLPIIGIMMSHLGYSAAAPATTTMINTIGFFQVSSILAAAPALGHLFGELNTKQSQLGALDFGDDNYHVLEEEIKHLKRKISIIPRNTMIVGAIGEPAILLMIFADPVLSLMQQDRIVAAPAQEFFRAYAPFFALFVPRLAMEFVLLTSQKQKQAMAIALATLGITIGMQYSLANQTSLGLTGLGIGSGVGVALTCLGFTSYASYAYKDLEFFRNFFSWEPADRRQIVDFIKQGGANVFTAVSDISVSFAASMIAGVLSADALILQNLATQYLNFNILMTAATSQTTMIMVSNRLGALKAGSGSAHSISQAVTAGVAANLLLLLPLTIFAVASPATFSTVVGTPVDETQARNLLLMTAAYAFIDGVRYNLLQSTRAVDDYVIPTVVSSSALWLGVGGSYVLSQFTELGILGIPLGLASGALLGTLFIANRMMGSGIKHATSAYTDRVSPPPQLEDNQPKWYQLFSRCKRSNPIEQKKEPVNGLIARANVR